MDYQRIYDQIIDRAKQEGRGKGEGTYYESHHIVPRCMGGSNKKENLVELTAREHFLCHQLLISIHPKNKKLAYALWGMCNQTGSTNNVRDYRVSSRTYQIGREAFIQAITGRACTWGNKISEAKKGISQGKRSKESVAKQKQTVASNPYTRTEKSKQTISEKLTNYKKTKEHRKAISETNKRLGIKPPTQATPVTVQGILYRSKKEACEALNIPRHILSKLLKK